MQLLYIRSTEIENKMDSIVYLLSFLSVVKVSWQSSSCKTKSTTRFSFSTIWNIATVYRQAIVVAGAYHISVDVIIYEANSVNIVRAKNEDSWINLVCEKQVITDQLISLNSQTY